MTESSVSAYRHHTAQPNLKPGAVAIAYAGLHKTSPDCDEQPSEFSPPDIDDLRKLTDAQLHRLSMRLKMVQHERLAKVVGPEGRFARVMVDVWGGHRVPIPVGAIMQKAAEDGQIKVGDLLKQQRGREFSDPRMRAMASVRNLRREDGRHAYTTIEVGVFFRRDHSTVSNAYAKVPVEDLITL